MSKEEAGFQDVVFEAEGGCTKWRGSMCTGNVSWEDVFKGEMLSLLGLDIRREAGKMLPQSRGVGFVRERGVCKQDGVGNRKVRPALGTLR